jgi:flagellar motor switch protein FliM
MPEEEEEDTVERGSTAAAAKRKPRNIQVCNFRSAGRLSNENSRALTAIYENFARYLASAMNASLGANVEVRFKSLEQALIKEHVAAIRPLSYIVPLSLSSLNGAMFLECSVDLVFPIIEVLLGGAGSSDSSPRELSEIEEEIMQDVTTIVARQSEQAWHLPHASLTQGRRIKASALPQFCAARERMTVARFEVEIAEATGTFDLVIPGSFVSILLNQIKHGHQPNLGRVRQFPLLSLRERMLDCDFNLAVTILPTKVAVRDLIALQPGCVLKLRAPVRASGMVSVGGKQIFEAAPVRNGSQKAAKLGRKTQRTSFEEE